MSLALSRRTKLGTGVPLAVPQTITGLQAWYKADAIGQADASAVASWVDSSGNSRPLEQGTGASQPTLRTAVLNSLPIVRFDGTDDSLATAAFTYNQPATIALVANTSGPNGGYYLDGLSLNTRVAQRNTDTVYRLFAGTVLDSTVTTQTAFHIAIVQFNGASSKLWYKGGAAFTGNAGTAGASGLTVGRGGGGGGTPIAGDIAEIAAYNTAMALADVNSLGNYLADRYALTWTTAT